MSQKKNHGSTDLEDGWDLCDNEFGKTTSISVSSAKKPKKKKVGWWKYMKSFVVTPSSSTSSQAPADDKPCVKVYDTEMLSSLGNAPPAPTPPPSPVMVRPIHDKDREETIRELDRILNELRASQSQDQGEETSDDDDNINRPVVEVPELPNLSDVDPSPWDAASQRLRETAGDSMFTSSYLEQVADQVESVVSEKLPMTYIHVELESLPAPQVECAERVQLPMSLRRRRNLANLGQGRSDVKRQRTMDVRPSSPAHDFGPLDDEEPSSSDDTTTSEFEDELTVCECLHSVWNDICNALRSVRDEFTK